MASVRLEDIYKVYGSHVGVRGINLDIPDESFVVLVGPSGCGKSTTLRMIAGLETISHGELWIGDTLANDLPSRIRGTAMVFQSYALYPHMSVRRNLTFSLKLAGLSKSEIDLRVSNAARILELEPYLDRKPSQLSGGQRQRVAMGRAIVREPKVFLFDEPLSNLDAKLRSQMRLEIKKLQRRLKVTTVYVTHDQVEAMTLADIVVVMKDGRIAQIGSPLEVFEHPVNKFVAGFMGSPPMNFIEGTVIAGPKGRHAFAGGGLTIPLPQERFQNLAIDQPATLGVRAEDIVPDDHGVTPRSAVTFRAAVSLTEMLGNETLLFFNFNGHDLVARMQQPREVAPDEMMTFRINAGRIHLFDSRNEASLSIKTQIPHATAGHRPH
jgi:multiple sugar transport system ATP-binding protein